MRKNLSTIILILIFLVGLSVMLYPSVSDAVNRKHQSRAVAGYAEEVEQLSDADYQTYFDAADAYNRQLNTTPNAFYKPDLVSGYAQTLDISGTGIMGYITIPKISVELPIYHGTDEGVLQVAAGHLEGSSLPVGGAGTHAVISAHRGLPSAKLFTNLDELEVGDRFTITVLNRVLTYEVDQISIVLPTEVDQLLPTEGMDYVTLMTCTPYGINTHRLLVRGKRVETTESQKHIRVAADAFRIEPIIVAPILAIPMLLAALVGVLVAPHLRKRSKRRRK
jgi:sortase A